MLFFICCSVLYILENNMKNIGRLTHSKNITRIKNLDRKMTSDGSLKIDCNRTSPSPTYNKALDIGASCQQALKRNNINKNVVNLSQYIDGIELKSCSLIVFDLETSGLGVLESEILQIAAVCKEFEFNCYVCPTEEISPSASIVNNLVQVDGVLFYKSEPVDSFILKDVIRGFLNWLHQIPPPRIILGHNIKKFDCPHFFYALAKCSLDEDFCNLVVGFVDTLPLLRELYPGMPNYRQNTLIKHILHDVYEEHNAIEDVRTLQKLIQVSEISNFHFMSHSFSSDSFSKFFLYKIEQKKKYSRIINAGYISKGIAEKFICSHYDYDDLVKAFHTGGREGLKVLLGEKIDGKCRGTQNNKVIDRIVKFLEASK